MAGPARGIEFELKLVRNPYRIGHLEASVYFREIAHRAVDRRPTLIEDDLRPFECTHARKFPALAHDTLSPGGRRAKVVAGFASERAPDQSWRASADRFHFAQSARRSRPNR